MIDRLMAEAPAFFTRDTAAFLGLALSRTLLMTVIGCGAGFVLGMVLAVVRRSRAGWLAPARVLAAAYVELFRRIPFLVILILVLFSVQAFAPDLSLLGIAAIAVTLAATAYLSEIVRAGLESVPRAQVEGADVLGLSAAQSFWLVILPQSWRVILPPAAAFMVMFIKDTALASHLGVVELAFSGKILVNRGFSPLYGFGAVLILYFLLSWPLGRMAAWLETRLAVSRHR
ncbi:MAG: amino acid ABC transporter permease [Alphaproteobacteria bacterium]|nr:MAG: amino acid ABC transporter permease [Alphaproteobacteria bacterium]